MQTHIQYIYEMGGKINKLRRREKKTTRKVKKSENIFLRKTLKRNL